MSYPTDCIQCRAIRRPCHRHRMTPEELSAQLARDLRVTTARLRREHPNASYLPHERRAIFGGSR